jgi:hypothetical protein
MSTGRSNSIEKVTLGGESHHWEERLLKSIETKVELINKD